MKQRALFIWFIHCALVKGMYRKRFATRSGSADGLAFFCVFIFLLFILVLTSDNTFLVDILYSGSSLAPFGALAGLLVVFLLELVFPSYKRKERIPLLRAVIQSMSGQKRIQSVGYVSVFLLLFVFTVVLGIIKLGY